jgi:probable HAF family extracellular repeat protein
MRQLSYAVALLVMFGVCAAARAGEYSFQDLGGVGGFAFDVSGDGRSVVGRADPGPVSFRWTAAGGMQPLATPAGEVSTAFGISGDASVAVGTIGDRAARWAGGAVELIRMPAGTLNSGAGDVSDDGSVVVGYFSLPTGTFQAFRWTAAGGTEQLGPVTPAEGTATAVSGDGTVVVGNANPRNVRSAFRWTATGGLQELAGPVGLTGETLAFAASRDGSVIVGSAGAAAASKAVRWVDGVAQVLGDAGNAERAATALGVSADGSVVVGIAPTADVPSGEAFVWDERNGMRSIRGLLQEQGIDLTGWGVWEAEAVSDDGRTIVGWGAHGPDVRAWLVTIPEPGGAAVLFLLAVPLLRRCRSDPGV